MAYLLSNICTKNYWNQKTVVEIIVHGWMVSFFLRHSVCEQYLRKSLFKKYLEDTILPLWLASIT